MEVSQKKVTNLDVSTSLKILRLTRRIPNVNGHGGDHRSLQIQELVYSIDYQLVDLFKKLAINEWSKYLSGLEFFLRSRFQVYPFYHPIYPIDIYHFYRAFKICGEEFLNYQNSMNQYSGQKLLLWEFTDKLVAPHLLKKEGFKIIAIPHNLESMGVNLQDLYNRQKILNAFKAEINYLAQADVIFTISREEQWLLNLYGVKADFLPYYPPEPILSNLLTIRQLRKQSIQSRGSRFLILGTVKNTPTFQGMIQQIETLKKLLAKISFSVDIAGHGTEKLKEYCNHPQFHLHGTVDTSKLDQLMVESKAVLIYQQSGVGALTRIPEMLIAGIPVIANGNACRSSFSYSGVYCYDNNDELTEFMSQDLAMPSLLNRPIEAEKRFTDCLKQLAS